MAASPRRPSGRVVLQPGSLVPPGDRAGAPWTERIGESAASEPAPAPDARGRATTLVWVLLLAAVALFVVLRSTSGPVVAPRLPAAITLR